ncbi:hypothetical protein [Acidocella sp.]|uniref:hypothetical protein n=1 Tax=Acidocella sp. TaxID=50710 RepID=UPI002D7F2286|nr:hypothetical protein [Acidocella sp.]
MGALATSVGREIRKSVSAAATNENKKIGIKGRFDRLSEFSDSSNVIKKSCAGCVFFLINKIFHMSIKTQRRNAKELLYLNGKICDTTKKK